NGLPSTLVFNIVANDNESLFFAATEAGPYVYVVAKDKWFDMSGLSAPTQTFWSVEFIPTYNIVRFGTYGRGIWDFRINDLSTVTNGPIADNKSIVFPNPFTNSFSLKTGNTGPYSIEMFSNSGQLVHAAKNVSDNLLVEPKNLRTGMYYVKINSNGKIRTEKIQKI
ncbi:MAG TPA: T9SS type A sorting domain-containing protein, partial [Saprospiraceae bacterium]|nr:T9SS type A sorting domain-containing protein [Saprospiraceae bacterium]